MQNRYIYLAGPISGLTESESREWRLSFMSQWAQTPCARYVGVLDPLRSVYAVNPGAVWGEAQWPATIDLSMMRDLSDIDRAEVVVFGGLETARKVSIGTMIEWGYARAKARKLMLLADFEVLRHSPHAHPWIDAHDMHAPTIEAAVAILNFYFASPSFYGPAGVNHGIIGGPVEPRKAEPDTALVRPVDSGVGRLRPAARAEPIKLPIIVHENIRYPSAQGQGGHAVGHATERIKSVSKFGHVYYEDDPRVEDGYAEAVPNATGTDDR